MNGIQTSFQLNMVSYKYKNKKLSELIHFFSCFFFCLTSLIFNLFFFLFFLVSNSDETNSYSVSEWANSTGSGNAYVRPSKYETYFI